MSDLNETLITFEGEKQSSWKKIIEKITIPMVFSFFFMLLSFSTVLYYITGPAEGYLHSDCTDSLLWSYATVETGEIIAQDFIYAAILPFSANLWMIPIIKIFGYTMTAQTISMVIFAGLFTASLIWVFRSLRFSWSMNFFSTGAMLMLLSSGVKMREIMWDHVIYYSLSLLLFNCLLALSLSVINKWDDFLASKSKKSVVYFCIFAGLLAILTTGTATDGVQVLLMTVIPVFVAIVGEAFFESKKKLLSVENAGKGAVAVILPIFSLFGLSLLKKIQGDVEVWYTDYYSNLTGIDNWQTNLFKFHKHFLTLIGFNDANKSIFPDEATEDILAETALYNILAIAVFIVLVIVPIVGAFFYQKFKNRETKIILIAYLTLFAAIMFLFICGNISNVNWRLVPIVGMSAMVVLSLANELFLAFADKKSLPDEESSSYEIPEKSGSISLRFASIIVCGFLVFSLVNVSIIRKIPKDFGRENNLHKLTEALIENDLTYGYATFWNSQAITLLSDSKVSCRDVNATDAGVKMYNYQTFNEWYEPQEGVDEYFILLSNSEYSTVMNTATWKKWVETSLIEEIVPLNGFKIFVFDSYPEGIK